MNGSITKNRLFLLQWPAVEKACFWCLYNLTWHHLNKKVEIFEGFVPAISLYMIDS